MTPKNRNKRIGLILLCGMLLMTGGALLFSALQQNTQFFYDPSEVLDPGFVAKSEDVRIGGLVLPGSVAKGEGLLTRFNIVDFVEGASVEAMAQQDSLQVTYSGILPDLFREGQGVVITGNIVTRDTIQAIKVLAKHDENYQPKM